MELFFILVRRSVKIALLSVMTVAFLLGGQTVVPAVAAPAPAPEQEIAQAPSYVPVAQVNLSVPGNVMIGESFTFTATFDNTSGTVTDVGYGPFIDIIFPVIGMDGAGAAANDGIDFVSAAHLGTPITGADLRVLTFPASPQGACAAGQTQLNHPFAVDASGVGLSVCGTPGNKFVSMRLPFGSFAADQPAAEVVINAALSNWADFGVPLTLMARGGFQFGATPLNDFCCGDPSIVTPATNDGTTWPNGNVTPTIASITKTYNGPEDETATGPNFPRRYTVSVDIANGQTLTNLFVTDNLPDNIQYVSFISSTPAGCTLTSTPSTSAPGGVLTCLFASVTGGAGANDASFTFEFYVPLANLGGGPVIDPNSGDDQNATNAANFSGSWDPLDSRDPITTVSDVCPTCHRLTAKSIAIQKGSLIRNDVGFPGYSPSDTLEYTLTFQVSDFFAFDQVDLTDILSDGLRFDGTFTPTLTVNGNPYAFGPVNINANNVDVSCNYTGGPGAECDSDDLAANNGRTTLVFNVSTETLAQAGTDRLIGGCVNPAGGSATPDCTTDPDGATTGTIVYRAVIQDLYSDDFPSSDPSVDHGDIMSNSVTIAGRILDTNALAPTGFSETDNSGSDLTIAFGSVQKTVYALNGDTNCGGSCANVRVKPGDTLTYRIQYTQPSSDFEPTTIDDYLPLPVFRVNDPDANGAAGPGWGQDLTPAPIPPTGQWKYGPADTLHLNPPLGPTPVVSIDASNNRLRFAYPAFDDPTNTTTQIDLIFSITVSSDPFADLLKLTNQVHVTEGTTQLNPIDTDAIVQITLTEPVLTSKKGVVATDNALGTFNPVLSAPIFNAPATGSPGGGAARWTGTISSANVANIATANLSGVDAGDLVTFAIVITNAGTSANGAFDITILDVLQTGYVIPAGGINLRIANGDNSTAFTFSGLGGGPDGLVDTEDDIFGAGVRIDDPNEGTPTPFPGACQAHHATNGHNILVLTYDLQIANDVTPNQGIINTASLVRYAGSEGGPNHLAAPLTDTATVTPFAAPTKVTVTTSELHTGVVAGNERLAVGEIIRYRVYSAVPEGSDIADLQVRDNLPNGLQFLDDGTVRVAFVSDTLGNMASTTLSPALPGCGNLYRSGSAVDLVSLPSANITCPLPDTSVSNSPTAEDDTYGTGTDIYFKLGNVRNDERDAGSEYVVVEFNARMLNSNANGSNQAFDNLNGTPVTSNRDNSAIVRSGTTDITGASPNVRVVVAEPLIQNLDKIELTTGPYDAGDTLTYRMTFSNTASGNNAATAFDLVFTDTLSTTLDFVGVNVISTQTSPCVGNGAGTTAFTTSNSVVGQLLTVNVSCLDQNRSVTITVDTRVNNTIPVGSTLTNTGYVTYTSLPGGGNSITVLDGNGTPNISTPGAGGTATGERNGVPGSAGTDGTLLNNYSDSDVLNSTIGSAFSIAKQLTATSTAHTAGSNVAIGEEITYSILLTFPEGTTAMDTVVDDLPAGLELVAGTPRVITTRALSGTPPLLAADFNVVPGWTSNITPVLGEGGMVTFGFANVVVNGDNDATNNTLLIQFEARVTNVFGNQAGTTLSNQATNNPGSGPTPSNTVDAIVVEPSITFGKTIVSLPTPLDAGGVVHYQITYANGTGPNVSTAMDVNITDALAAALLLPSNTAPHVAITSSGGVGAITNNSTTSSINITVASVPPGESVTINFYPVIQSSITPGQIIDNIGNSTWTSLSGTVTGERTGVNGPTGSPDNYAAVSNAQFTMPLSQSITKQLTTTSASHTAGSNVTIGEELTYDILLTFPEGMTPSDTVVDTLPAGLEIVDGSISWVTIAADSGGLLMENFSATAGYSLVGDTDLATNSARFTFTNVSLPGDNNVANNTILLRFRALVLNLDDNDNTDTLSNTATNQVGASAPTSSNTVNAIIVEPVLNLTKQVSDPNPAVGQVLTFTLTLSHAATSAADAFDVVLTDDVPVELALDPASITVTAGGTGTVTNLQTNHSGNHLEVTADSVPQGATIQIAYKASVAAPYAASFQNTAIASWTSLPGTASGERNGSGTPTYNNYQVIAHAPINVTRALVKNLVASNVTSTSPDQIVTIGEILTYQVVLTIPAGSTDTAIITDTLNNGLAFVDCAATAPVGGMHDIMAGSHITISNFPFALGTYEASCRDLSGNPQISNSGGTIRWDLGRITNGGPTAETITLTYRVIVLDVGANVQNVTLDNDVAWTWTGGSLSTRAAPSLRIVEPDLQIEKTVDPEVAALGSTLTYSIDIQHTTDSLTTAYDVLVTDGIPTGLTLDPTSVTVTGSVGLPAAVITTSPTQLSVYWPQFPLGATATVTFDAVFVGPSPVFNTANVEWSSLQIDPAPRFQPQSAYSLFSTERRYDPLDQTVNDYAVSSTVSVRVPSRLPKTGFAPGQVTILPEQPADFSYNVLGDLWLEIPRLGVKVNIVGVPFTSEKNWNLTWLGSQAGYLEGTAYPTHAGNSGVTAHAYLADGSPGVFVDLNKLSYGDQIIVHMGGQRYIYEVRENKLVRPNDLSVLKHEKYSWLTLLTCKTYNEYADEYQFRVSVRAVLIKVENE